ncbi:MAG: type III-A CRISPR-associated RAMP protein Csm4 [Deltaproteobacteria bacterium]|nr:type III-A CRISPR-associated RAMP protein Csm4 [Deltaproteobacteria bacterium]
MNRPFLICRLAFKSGLHLGTREGALEGTEPVAHSDTLYSAFLNGYRYLYGEKELERLIALFLEEKKPFLFSSAFPFWKGVDYLPVPKNQIPRDKESKKIEYVDTLAFSRMLQGESLEDLRTEKMFRCIPAMDEDTEDGEKYPWKIQEAPRVGLDRRFNHPGDRYFHCSEAFFVLDAGLYFLIQVNDNTSIERIFGVWNLMADEGIGGDRSVGKGLFHYCVPGEFSLEVPDDADGQVLLSLYYPADSELDGIQKAYYTLIPRRGYVFSPAGQSLRRKSVMMFTEGSVFPAPPFYHGLFLDVTPDLFQAHRVFRAGTALSIPCRLNGRNP